MGMISKVTDGKGADGDIDKDEQNDLSVSKDWPGWARQRTIMLVLLVLQAGYIPEFQNGLLCVLGVPPTIERRRPRHPYPPTSKN
ncbi:MAG TPA: hypothetical protein VIX91_18975 [Candidatus Acidoferrum sp.]